jgi:hypothetical protein
MDPCKMSMHSTLFLCRLLTMNIYCWAFLATLALGLVGKTHAASCTPVFINEFHYDNSGTDQGEFIEIAGPAGTNLNGWKIVLYNGSDGAQYDSIALSGTIVNEGSGFGAIGFPRAGIQNGSPDGFALVDNYNQVVQFLSYEGTFTAVNGPAMNLMSTDVGVEEPSNTPVGDSLQLTGTGICYEGFTWNPPAAASLGTINQGQTFGCPGVPCTDVFINELHYDNVGQDVGEFVEIGGPAGTNLDGWCVVLYNGANGKMYDTIPLSGTLLNQDLGFGTRTFTPPNGQIQNGEPDGLALVAPGGCVAQFLSYEGEFTATDGFATGMTSTDIGVFETNETLEGQSLQLRLATGEGTCAEDFEWEGPTDATPGCVNKDQFNAPTSAPSSAPSLMPSVMPSSLPSLAPSAMPSGKGKSSKGSKKRKLKNAERGLGI